MKPEEPQKPIPRLLISLELQGLSLSIINWNVLVLIGLIFLGDYWRWSNISNLVVLKKQLKFEPSWWICMVKLYNGTSIMPNQMRVDFFRMVWLSRRNECQTLVSLKHTNTVEEYYEEFLQILNSLQLHTDYSMSVFISNLKLDISKTVRLFSHKSLTHALNLAKQLESFVHNSNKRPFIPYKNPSTSSSNIYNISSTFKTSSLPPLFPNPNLPQLLSSSYSYKYSQYNKSSLTNQTPNSPKTSKMPIRQKREEMRRNWLCMSCRVNFIGGHKCLKSQSYHMLVESDSDVKHAA